MYFVNSFQYLPIRNKGFIRVGDGVRGRVPLTSDLSSVRWVEIGSVNEVEGDFSYLLRPWELSLGRCWVLNFPRSMPLLHQNHVKIYRTTLHLAPRGEARIAGLDLNKDLAWLLGFCSPAVSPLISLTYHDPIPRLSQLIKDIFGINIKVKDYSGESHVPAFNIKLPSALWDVLKPDVPLAIKPQILKSEDLSLSFIAGFMERLYKERGGDMILAPSPRGDSYTRTCSFQVAALASSCGIPCFVEWRNGFSLSFLNWHDALERLSPYITENSSLLFSMMEMERVRMPVERVGFIQKKVPVRIRRQIGKVEVYVLNVESEEDEHLLVAQSGLLIPITKA